MLTDLRILAVEQYGAGLGTPFLADLGAAIVKFENRADGGDVSRLVGPRFDAALPETAQSLFFQGLNRGKKRITRDLGRPAGQAACRRLAKHAGAMTSNQRGERMLSYRRNLLVYRRNAQTPYGRAGYA